MILAIVGLTVAPDKIEETLSVLRLSATSALAEGGCRSSRLWRESDTPGRLLLVEEWDTKADLERHFGSPHYHRVLAAIEMSSAPPEIRFLEITGERGLDWVEQTRAGSKP